MKKNYGKNIPPEEAVRVFDCSISHATLFLAFKKLFAEAGYTLSEETAQAVYNSTCNAVGLTPSAIKF